MRRALLFTAGIPALMVFPHAVSAQVTAPAAASDRSVEAASIDEIIVTARKRSESVQDVPISVAAISGAALQARGLNNFVDLPAITSGVTVRKTTTGGVDFRIRGLGTGSGNDSFEQSVALFIDGSYASRAAEYNQPLFDIERVEILKGTQAALLAKNTSLGAVSITTRKPGSDFAFDLTGSYEFNLKSHVIEGGVDVPLTDTFAVRFSGQAEVQGGWVKNVLNGHDYGRTKSLGGRVVAVWKPTSDFDATLMYLDYSSNLRGLPIELLVDNLGGARNRAQVAGQLANYETRLDRRSMASDSIIGETTDHTSGRRGVLTLNKRFGDYTLTSVSSYSEFDKTLQFDNDYYVGTYITDPPSAQHNNQMSQELRITSPAAEKFNFVAGLFGLREKWYFDRDIVSASPGLSAATPGGTALIGSTEEHFLIETKSISAFGAANYEFLPGLTASLSLRGTKENKEAHFNRFTIVPGLLTSFLYPPIAPSSRSITETSLDGSAGLQYKIRPGFLTYGSFSRGTKGGGFLNSPSTPDLARYDPEQANTFEGGFKFTSGRNLLNIALFHTKVKKFQQSIFLGTVFVTQQLDVTSKGAEVDAALELAPGLRLTGSATYADSKLPDGTSPINAPKWSANGNISYKHSLNDALDIELNGGAEFRSRVIWGLASQTVGVGTSAATTVLVPTPANTKFNARIAVGPTDGRWQLALIGRNLANKLTVDYATSGPFLNGAGFGVPSLPRTVKVSLTVRR